MGGTVLPLVTSPARLFAEVGEGAPEVVRIRENRRSTDVSMGPRHVRDPRPRERETAR
jgi:hypothetical protein